MKKKRGVSLGTGAVALTAAFAAVSAKAEVKTDKPNILMILVDDQGYGDMACHGHPFLQTPNMDRLHSQSVRLTNFHVASSCSPSRAQLLTGRHQFRVGVTDVRQGRSVLRGGCGTIATVLKSAGYQTALFGKWHLGDSYPNRPEDNGFDEVLSWHGATPDQSPNPFGNTKREPWLIHNGTWEKYDRFVDDVLFEKAADWLERNHQKPFFLMLSTSGPHGSWFTEIGKQYVPIMQEKGVPDNAAGFFGMITNIDEHMGELFAHLESLGVIDNTLIIFMSDNGSDISERFGFYNAGMKGGKNSIYEGGDRVFCFLRYPGRFPADADIPSVTTAMDILPTVADLCGADIPESVRPEGRSLVPLLEKPETAWPSRYIPIHRGKFGPVTNDPERYKYALSAIRSDRYRLQGTIDLRGDSSGFRELYDMVEDPGQTRNVINQFPELAEQMQKAYDDWWAGIKPDFAEPVRSTIGSDAANPTHLTLYEWTHSQVDRSVNNGFTNGDKTSSPLFPAAVKEWLNNGTPIPKGYHPMTPGSWYITVAQPGTYRFVLRPVPEGTLDAPGLRAGTACVQVGSLFGEAEVVPGSASAVVQLELEAGDTFLECWFTGQVPGEKRIGAYYVKVERL